MTLAETAADNEVLAGYLENYAPALHNSGKSRSTTTEVRSCPSQSATSFEE
jgi:hypothetical protein